MNCLRTVVHEDDGAYARRSGLRDQAGEVASEPPASATEVAELTCLSAVITSPSIDRTPVSRRMMMLFPFAPIH